MRYLGRVSGSGVIRIEDEDAGSATFEFECYLIKPNVVTSSGEIKTAPDLLKRMFGRNDVQFVTDDGHLLKLILSDKKVAPSGSTAHVDASGDLPVVRGAALHWPARTETPAA